MEELQPDETNNNSTMIKGKFKKTVLRRDSNSAPFRPAPIETKPSDSSIPTSELTSLSRPRTRDDESIFVNTGKVSPMIKEAPRFSRRSTFSEESPLRKASDVDDDNTAIDEFVDRLNIGKIGDFLKKIIIAIWKRLQNSKYINSDNDGRIHLQSFCIGVILTSVVVMIQPFLVVYLDSWIVLLGRLFKHLMAWVMVAAVLSYAFNTSKKAKQDKESHEVVAPRLNNFEKLHYRVKNSSNNSSRSTSPTKSLKNKNGSRPSFSRQSFSSASIPRRDSTDSYNDQMILMNITERIQQDEKFRIDHHNNDKPKDNYEKFMDVAYKKNQEHDIYNKFVNDSKENVRRLSKH